MKKIWMAIGELAGFKVSEGSDVDYKVQEAELEKVKSALEEAKGYKEAKEAAEASMKTATDAQAKAEADLKAANEAKEKVDGELKTANERIAALEKENTELKGDAGAVGPTATGGEGGEGADGAEGLPSYVKTDSAHMKALADFEGTLGRTK